MTLFLFLLRDASSRNTPPPVDPSGGVFYLRIVLSPEESSRPCVFQKIFFHGEELLAPDPTPKLENHSLSAVRHFLFNLFAATLLIGSHSSIRNLRTPYAVVKGATNTAIVSVWTQNFRLFFGQFQIPNKFV